MFRLRTQVEAMEQAAEQSRRKISAHLIEFGVFAEMHSDVLTVNPAHFSDFAHRHHETPVNRDLLSDDSETSLL